jgi:hypothetical protein
LLFFAQVEIHGVAPRATARLILPRPGGAG